MLPSSGLLDDPKWTLLMDPGEWGVSTELGNHRVLSGHQSFPTGNFRGAGERRVKAAKLDKRLGLQIVLPFHGHSSECSLKETENLRNLRHE